MSCMAHLQSQQLCLASVDKQHNQKNQPHHFGMTNTVIANILIYRAGKKQASSSHFLLAQGNFLLVLVNDFVRR